MNALFWFIAGGFAFGGFLGLALFVLFAGRIRERCYRVCREQVLIEYGIRPAVAEGHDPAAAVRWPALNRQEPERPAPIRRPVFHTPN